MELLFLGLRGWQLIIVVLAIVLLFGANKIPDLMRNLGRGVHSFRQGVEDAKAEINKEVKKATDIDTDAKQ
ncbi:MAG: twin-arginine translocase TatA/TatE family subunit [Bacteroidales bacterium]|nr:twin-arginine translocase TatA/TatE family subunit [Bacteroidales bacterium]